MLPDLTNPALLAALMAPRRSKHRAGWRDWFSKANADARFARKKARRKAAHKSRMRNKN